MQYIKVVSIVISLGWSVLGYSALAPSALHLRDLDTMVDFVRKHQDVATNLESIDLVSLRVLYNNNCEAKFVRSKPSLLSLGRPGPQPGIKFKSSTCPLSEMDESAQ
jgi:hypothetical protein